MKVNRIEFRIELLYHYKTYILLLSYVKKIFNNTKFAIDTFIDIFGR